MSLDAGTTIASCSPVSRAMGVTIDRSTDLGWTKLFARELGGRDIVSFNLYRTPAGKVHLRPCEMSSAKVIDFVCGFSAETSDRSTGTIGKGA